MQGDDVQLLHRLLHHSSRLPREVQVAAPMEPVPPDPQLLVETVRDSIRERTREHGGMEGCVENSDLRAAEQVLGHTDALPW